MNWRMFLFLGCEYLCGIPCLSQSSGCGMRVAYLTASCCSLSTRGRREIMPLAKPSCHSRQTNSVVCTSCSASFPTTCSGSVHDICSHHSCDPRACLIVGF